MNTKNTIMNEMNTKIYNYEITVLNAKNEPKVYKTTRTYTATTKSTTNKEAKERISK